MGIAIIEISKTKPNLIFTKTISPKKNQDISKKLLYINDEINKILMDFQIDFAGIESTFININPKTSINLAISKGIILMNLAKFNINYTEISPNIIKKHITGYGHSNKDEIKSYLKYHINIDYSFLDLDNHSIDAISIALLANHINESQILIN